MNRRWTRLTVFGLSEASHGVSLEEDFVRLALTVSGILAVLFGVIALVHDDLWFGITAILSVVLASTSIYQLTVGRPNLSIVVAVAGAFLLFEAFFLPQTVILALLLSFSVFAAAATFSANPWMTLWFGAVVIGGGVVTIVRSGSPGMTIFASVAVLVVGNGLGGLLHRQAGHLLRVQANRWNTLMDSAVDAILVVDRSATLVMVNQGACEMFGYQGKSELEDRSLNDLLPPRYRRDHINLIAEFVASPVSARPMSDNPGLTGLRKSGEEFPVDVSISKMDDGEELMMAIVRDVTEREAQVREIEDVSRARIELLASVAHEVRTPLSSVLGFAELLSTESSTLTPEEKQQAIQSIATGATEMTDLVEDLLVGARIEIGQLVVAQVPVDIGAQVAQVTEALQMNVDIRITGDAVASGDPGRVRQILRNLLTNAVRHGGPNIRIDVQGGDATCRVAVSEVAEAISRDDQQRIFARFETRVQSHGLTGSVGIGLPLSRDLAIRMGGDVTYRHDGGRNIFELSLPRWEGTDGWLRPAR